MEKGQNLISGTWVNSKSEDIIQLINPSDGGNFASIPRSGAIDIDLAAKSARRAFDKHWSKTPAFERGKYLQKISNKIYESIDELAIIESKDTGKPLKQSRVDAQVAARYFEFYAGAADKIHGEVIPSQQGINSFTKREPHGVTGHIIPWNYPLQMGSRTFAASLAAGNCVVIKPAEEACLSVLKIANFAIELGLPPDVINIVTGYGDETGSYLCKHRDIDHVCFTGSPEVGSLVQQNVALSNKSCTMELGGKSPHIVFSDCDLENAMPVILNSIIQNSGQTCSAGSRLIIDKDIKEKFLNLFTEKFSNLLVGSSDMDLDMGPLISETQKNRVLSFYDKAKKESIPILASGSISEQVSKNGFYVNPLLLGPVPVNSTLATDEIFGPYLCVIPFSNEDEAVSIANGTDYGLTAGIWTKDGSRQMRVANSLKCGQVFINCYGAGGGVEIPFGGMKKSGFGREKGMEGLRELTVCKTIVQKFN